MLGLIKASNFEKLTEIWLVIFALALCGNTTKLYAILFYLRAELARIEVEGRPSLLAAPSSADTFFALL